VTFFVHPQGLCEATQIGAGTRIWAFAHLLPGARIGTECNIGDHVFIGMMSSWATRDGEVRRAAGGMA
jgi:bifunctional N-acetylglucosamine-1-phosphate-uridyltransferase/glucosamine-1-phosphate-acetyltransferase GlmU-like protein